MPDMNFLVAYAAVDRQDYTVNGMDTADKMNSVLHAVGKH